MARHESLCANCCTEKATTIFMCDDSGAILIAMPESTKEIFLLKENINTFVNPVVKFWRHRRNVLGSSHLARGKSTFITHEPIALSLEKASEV